MRWTARIITAALVALAATGIMAQDESQPVQILATDVTYIVVERDNLDGIGAFFDVRVGCIRGSNNLEPGHILQPGDQLAYQRVLPGV